MGFGTQDVDRKVLTILRVLNDSHETLGARVISRRLKDHGIDLGERAVRYHLKMTDERGMTRLVGRRDGRVLTERGMEEVRSALVRYKVGLAISKIELLTCRTSFDPRTRTGAIPVNVSFFPRERFNAALEAMRLAFSGGLCVSSLVAAAEEGERLGELVVPQGTVGLATVCSIAFNGTLLKAGVPIDSKFGGVLQLRERRPHRFVEVIHYAGSSLDPSEVFIRAGMTSVREATGMGEGRILANFREIPAMCRKTVGEVVSGLEEAGLKRPLLVGNVSEQVCEVPVELNRFGVILVGGLNPVAAAHEAGIEAENHAMSTVLQYQDMVEFHGL